MARPKKAVLEYRNYEFPAAFPILVLTGDVWHISHVPSKHLHFHNCLEIGICWSGSGTLIFHEDPVPFRAGDITCIARNVPHTTFSDENSESLWSYIMVQPTGLLRGDAPDSLRNDYAYEQMLSSCHMVIHGEDVPCLTPLVHMILDEMTSGAPGYPEAVRGLVQAMMVQFLRVWTESSGSRMADRNIHAIAPALDYVHDHYMESFTQKHLADLCHMSQTHFRRVFSAQIGTNPLNFLHQTRILESCTFLRATDLPVAEIAERVGYQSLSSFNRHFQSALSCTPSVWRKQAGRMPAPAVLTYTGWMKAEIPDSSN